MTGFFLFTDELPHFQETSLGAMDKPQQEGGTGGTLTGSCPARTLVEKPWPHSLSCRDSSALRVPPLLWWGYLHQNF